MIFVAAFFALSFGLILGYILRVRMAKMKAYTGTIYVAKNDGRISYSLELEDDPENLQYETEVVFRVVAPKESPIRE